MRRIARQRGGASEAAGVVTLAATMLGLALTGCGGRTTAGTGLVPVDQALPTPSFRRCVYANDPTELPTVDQVLPPGLGGSLGLWGYGGDPADTLTLSIRYGPDGGLQWVRLVGAPPTAGTQQELERLVGTAVPATGKPDWGVRLRVTADGTPVGVLPAVVCPAVPMSQLPTPEPRLRRRDLAEFRGARGRRLEARVLLDDRGRILDVDLWRGSGSRVLDQHFLASIRDTAFRPHLHDGFPVAAIATVTYDPW